MSRLSEYAVATYHTTPVSQYPQSSAMAFTTRTGLLRTIPSSQRLFPGLHVSRGCGTSQSLGQLRERTAQHDTSSTFLFWFRRRSRTRPRFSPTSCDFLHVHERRENAPQSSGAIKHSDSVRIPLPKQSAGSQPVSLGLPPVHPLSRADN